MRTSATPVPGQPFGIAVTSDGKWSFVSLGNSIAVLSKSSGLAPSLVRTIPVTRPAQGEALTPDGRYLLAASGSGAVVVNVAAAEQGSPNAVAGTLTSPGGKGAVGVAVSRDGRTAFVTLQFSNTLAVFNLRAALSKGFGPSALIGTIPLGVHPVGINGSRDGRWLYVVSQQRNNTTQQGMLSVLSVQKAAVKPATSIVATAPAGCHPVRVITADHGNDVWVTVRESNALLGFSASKLRSDPAHALIARVRVGQSPIGLAPVQGGARIVVANSNLAGHKGAAPSLAVVSTSAAMDGKPALVGLIKSGLLPRQFALEPDGRTLLVTNSSSRQVEAVDVSHLP